MYLVDEPEQRLHPALQRRAARWLQTAMSQWDASSRRTRSRSSTCPTDWPRIVEIACTLVDIAERMLACRLRFSEIHRP
jgi:hypothetical protein